MTTKFGLLMIFANSLDPGQAWHSQGTKIFLYCPWPVGCVTYNFHSSCKHMLLSFKSVCNKNIRYVIWLPQVILPKALILQDECFGGNYSSFLVFTCNYKRTSGIFVPWNFLKNGDFDLPSNCLTLLVLVKDFFFLKSWIEKKNQQVTSYPAFKEINIYTN